MENSKMKYVDEYNKIIKYVEQIIQQYLVEAKVHPIFMSRLGNIAINIKDIMILKIQEGKISQDLLNEISSITLSTKKIIKLLEQIKKNFFAEFGHYMENIEKVESISDQLKEIFERLQKITKSPILKSNFLIEFNPNELKMLDQKHSYINQNNILNKGGPKKFKFQDRMKNEYALLVWLDNELKENEIGTQYQIWESMSKLIQQVENTELGQIQKVNIFRLLDCYNNNTITPEDTNQFFDIYWANGENRNYLISQENTIDEQKLQGTEKLRIIVLEAGKNDKHLETKQFYINRQGVMDSQQKRYTVCIGRKSKLYFNDIELNDGSISRRQLQMLYKPKLGFCLVCTSTTNPAHLSLQKGEERPLFYDGVVEIDNFYKVVVQDISNGKKSKKQAVQLNNVLLVSQYVDQNINNSNKQIQEQNEDQTMQVQKLKVEQIMKQEQEKQQIQQEQEQESSDSDDGTIKLKKGDRKKKAAIENEKEQVTQTMKPFKKQDVNKPFISLYITNHLQQELKGTQVQLNENPVLIKYNNTEAPLIIGNQQIKDQNIPQNLIKIEFIDNEWIVSSFKGTNISVSYWLKTDKQNNNFEKSTPSKAFQLKNNDEFGIDLGDNERFVFRAEILDDGLSENNFEGNKQFVQSKGIFEKKPLNDSNIDSEVSQNLRNIDNEEKEQITIVVKKKKK